jgi:uncharacterized protein YneF (UPF0154 family)
MPLKIRKKPNFPSLNADCLRALILSKVFRLSDRKMFCVGLSFRFCVHKAVIFRLFGGLFIALCIEKQVVIERVFLNESAINLIYFSIEFPYYN